MPSAGRGRACLSPALSSPLSGPRWKPRESGCSRSSCSLKRYPGLPGAFSQVGEAGLDMKTCRCLLKSSPYSKRKIHNNDMYQAVNSVGPVLCASGCSCTSELLEDGIKGGSVVVGEMFAAPAELCTMHASGNFLKLPHRAPSARWGPRGTNAPLALTPDPSSSLGGRPSWEGGEYFATNPTAQIPPSNGAAGLVPWTRVLSLHTWGQIVLLWGSPVHCRIFIFCFLFL